MIEDSWDYLCGVLKSILNYESYHYALSHDKTQAAKNMQRTYGRGLGPVTGYLMCTDTDFGNHSHLSTTFSPSEDKLIILTDARRKDKQISNMRSHGTVQLEVTTE